MADDITLPGNGEKLAYDDIGGTKYPRNKMCFGADGTATEVSSANPFPVTSSLASGAATEARQATLNNSAGSIDDKLTNGNQRAIVRSGTKGSSTPLDVTGTASGANHTGLDVIIYDTAGNPITSFGGINRTTPTETLVTVTDASTPVLPANAARKSIRIQNQGTNPVRIRYSGGTATFAGAGQMLYPNETDDQYNVDITAITAICASGLSTILYVKEGN